MPNLDVHDRGAHPLDRADDGARVGVEQRAIIDQWAWVEGRDRLGILRHLLGAEQSKQGCHARSTRSGRVGFLHLHLIHVAPPPRLPRLERLHDRMLDCLEVFRGVLVLRGVTTTDVTAAETEAEVHPRVPDRETLFAAPRLRCDVPDLIEVRALHGEPG
jgi:hypothetical protein